MRRGGLEGLILLCGLLASSPFTLAANFPGEQPTYARETGLEQRFFYVAAGSDGENQVEYICQCFPGTIGCGDTADDVWQVKRFSYNSSDQLTRIEFAGADDAYVHICDNRVSLSY